MSSNAVRTLKPQMNTAFGKSILSLVRGGDYAHPGEEEAIDLAFESLVENENRQVVDIGCGLGGTADYFQSCGLGKVTGVDIDPDTIVKAAAAHPVVTFRCSGAENFCSVAPGPFEIAYMFNSFYTFADQKRALAETNRALSSDGRLMIFDYFVRSDDSRAEAFRLNYVGSLWDPLTLDLFPPVLDETGFELLEQVDITVEYERWYAELLTRMLSKKEEILSLATDEWYESAFAKYNALYRAVRDKVIGGVIIWAGKSKR